MIIDAADVDPSSAYKLLFGTIIPRAIGLVSTLSLHLHGWIVLKIRNHVSTLDKVTTRRGGALRAGRHVVLSPEVDALLVAVAPSLRVAAPGTDRVTISPALTPAI